MHARAPFVLAAITLAARFAAPAGAQSCGNGYDFNGLMGSDAHPYTALDGQDGWTAVTFNTGVECGVTDTLGFDGTQALRFQEAGPGFGCDASRLNDASYSIPAFTGNETTAFFQADFGVGYWGNSFGPGYDLNGNGEVRGSEAGERGPRLNVGSNNAVVGITVISAAGNATMVPLSTAGGAVGGDWLRLRLVMNLSAGAGNVDYINLTQGGTDWAPVVGLQNVALDLTPGSGDAADPTNWHALWLHFEGATNQLDNLDVGLVACDLGSTPFCFGDGSGTPCACGNSGGGGEGCANSTGAGATLSSAGSSSISDDDISFAGANLLPSQPALLFVGQNAINNGDGVAFGDGLRCAGLNVVRLGVQVPDAIGSASWGPGLSATGGWNPGDTRYFQIWYRDPNGGPCGTGFNLSHGVELTFDP